jgi:hypothetical protein
MLNHKCDIYHTQRQDVSPGYGLPASPLFSYPETPDIEGAVCHFNIKSGSRIIVQNEPGADYEAKIKLVLPLETDVRLNDKIVDCDSGYEYTADIPVRIRDHHQYVMVRRTAAQKRISGV